MFSRRGGFTALGLLLLAAAPLAAQSSFYLVDLPDAAVQRDDQGNIIAIEDDGPPHAMPLPHWFVGAEVDVVDPSFTHLATTRDGRAFTFLGKTHSLGLDWSVAPEAELGYRFDGGGAFRVAYRGLASTGRKDSDRLSAEASYPFLFSGLLNAGYSSSPGGPMRRDLTGRLDEHWLDVDYVAPHHALCDGWWDWFGGARFASLFADFRVRDQFPLVLSLAGDPSQVLPAVQFTIQQYASHHSYGAGGHLGLEGAYPLGDTNLSLFGTADGGVLAAGNRQNFSLEAQAGLPGAATSPHGASTTSTGPGVIPTLNVRTGLIWMEPLGRVRQSLSGGYELEDWWFIATGDRGGALFTHIDELSHGPFARLRLDF